MNKSIRPEKVLYVMAALAIVLGALKMAAGVLVPGLLALFIAIVRTEPMYWLVERGVPRWAAIILVVLMLIGLSSLMPVVIGGSFVQFTNELPVYQERLDALLVRSSAELAEYGYDLENLRTIFDLSAALGWVQVILTALGGLLSMFLLIMLLVIFILVDVPKSLGDGEHTAAQIIRTVQHYFAIKTFTSLLTGTVVAVFLLVVDVQYPYLWGFVDGEPIVNRWRRSAQVPASTSLSDQLSKDLKRRGFRFVGTTICYAYLQAVGVVNDHLVSCFRHAEV